MEIYLVGGAVRDQLLGQLVKERDWVVVGATAEEMIVKGFKPVGKDFPVFLHPETKEEYALARTERKSGRGYTGFICYAAPDVSLEDDLQRRDLTINAMAEAENGTIIDPYGGQEDLKNKILRHVSPAFVEDPLRVLRVARFAARYNEFNVHPDTLKLMQEIVDAGELNELVPERVWVETVKALNEPYPERYFVVLQECSALRVVFPEILLDRDLIYRLYKAANLSSQPHIRFAVLMYHLQRDKIISLCNRLRAPTQFCDLALLLNQYIQEFTNSISFSADEMLSFMEKLDAFRRTERFLDFVFCCTAIDTLNDLEKKIERIKSAFEAAVKVRFVPEGNLKNLTGIEVGDWIRKARQEAIAKVLKNK